MLLVVPLAAQDVNTDESMIDAISPGVSADAQAAIDSAPILTPLDLRLRLLIACGKHHLRHPVSTIINADLLRQFAVIKQAEVQLTGAPAQD